jgi:hypothetical protein
MTQAGMFKGYVTRLSYNSLYACPSGLHPSVILSHMQASDAQRLCCLLSR